MVNVTKDNFLVESNRLINELPTAAFVAVDLEMTGIHLPIESSGAGSDGSDSSKDEALQDRYQQLRKAPERYSIIQFGIAVFHENTAFRNYVLSKNDVNVDRTNNTDEESPVQQHHSFDSEEDDDCSKSFYDKLKQSSHQNNGESDNLFKASGVEPPEFLCSKYNFFLFPPAPNHACLTREITLNPSSISFLNEHEMDFNTWMKEGIPYTTLDRAHFILQDFKTKYDKKMALDLAKEANYSPPTPKKPSVEPFRQEDVAFVARTMALLREWIDSPRPAVGMPPDDNNSSIAIFDHNEATSFVLPQCNSFLRKCLYEAISYEYPDLILEKAPPPHIHCIWVLRLTAQEKKEREERIRFQEWVAIHMEKIGFTRIFEALSKACRGTLNMYGSLKHEYQQSLTDNTESFKKKKYIIPPRPVPLIVHNGVMDLLFLLTHCHSHALPESYHQAKALISHYFPIIYDTKIMSTECVDSSSSTPNVSTALGDLFQRLCSVEAGTDRDAQNLVTHLAPRVQVINDPIEKTQRLALHEAAYDAYMTGAVFHALARKIIGGPDSFSFWMATGCKNLSTYILSRNDGFGSLFFLDERSPLHITSPLFGRNKLFIMRSLYNMDLSNPNDDTFKSHMSPSTTFRVSGKDMTGITTRDIVQCLKGVIDSSSVTQANPNPCKVEYEIIWVNDTTFLVSTRGPEHASLSSSDLIQSLLVSNDCGPLTAVPKILENETVLKRHASLIFHALKSKFPSLDILTLQDYLEKQQVEKKKTMDNATTCAKIGILNGLWQCVQKVFLGSDTMKRKRDD